MYAIRSYYALGFREYVFRYDVQFRNQFEALGAGLKGPRSGRGVFVFYVRDRYTGSYGPIDRPVDIPDYVPVVFGNVVLDIDDHQGLLPRAGSAV